MGARIFINVASAASGAVILASLVIVGVLVNDLNTLYSDVLSNMDDFKLLANDAWDEIMSVHGMIKGNHEKSAKELFSELISRGRDKRQINCACAPPAYGCPPGPQGPQGDPGLPGGESIIK
ncbi:Cuticle collagen dpy-5 [Toxocara canis]|uniref:Cuticle collagen dpy-5 n=1 Tax=Toxocara canis TaxID=6265 RepID=A0A0B2UQV5_TOXCA|nr:Cuticle collagen dpy-5 [Toxocara canis]